MTGLRDFGRRGTSQPVGQGGVVGCRLSSPCHHLVIPSGVEGPEWRGGSRYAPPTPPGPSTKLGMTKIVVVSHRQPTTDNRQPATQQPSNPATQPPPCA